MMKKLSDIVIFSMLTLGCFPLFSQEIESDTIKLKEVVVKEHFPKLPGIQHISCDSSLHNQSADDLGNVLSGKPGIIVKSMGEGSTSTVSIRGAGATHTQLIWNDLIVNSPMLGQADFSLIPSYFIDNVSVFVGNNSLFHHAPAMGGVVSIQNKANWDIPIKMDAQMGWGSFHSYHIGLTFNYLINKNVLSKTRLFYRSSLNDFTYTNKAVLPQVEQKNTDAAYYNFAVFQELFYKVKSHQFSFRFLINNSLREIPSLMTSGNAWLHDENQTDKSLKISAKYEFAFKNGTVFSTLGFSYSDLLYRLEHKMPQGSITAFNSQNNENVLTLNSGGNYHFKKGILRYGLHAVINDVSILDYKYNSGYTSQRKEGSLYANYELPLFNVIKTVISLHKPIVENISAPFLPAVFLQYKPFKKHSLSFFGSYAINFKAPTLNDLYFTPGGNANLIPEKSKGFELGFENCFHFLGVNCILLNVTTFYQEINDWILWQPSQFGYWSPLNIRNAISKGYSASVTWNGKWRNVIVYFNGNYTYNLAEASENEYSTGQMAYLPLHSFSQQLDFSINNWKVIYDNNYSSQRKTALYANTWSPILESHFIQNMAVSRKMVFKKWNVNAQFAVKNIFDVDYQQVLWRPLPGRYFEISLKWNIK